MPVFRESVVSHAPAHEVFKVLHDPARIPEWWAGVARIDDLDARREGARFALRMEDDSIPALPQVIEFEHQAGRVVMSCLTTESRFEWRLVADGAATRIETLVEAPDDELLEGYRQAMSTSLPRLARLAEGVA